MRIRMILKKRIASRLRALATRLDPPPTATTYVGQYPAGVYGASGTAVDFNVTVHR